MLSQADTNMLKEHCTNYIHYPTISSRYELFVTLTAIYSVYEPELDADKFRTAVEFYKRNNVAGPKPLSSWEKYI